MSNNIRLHLNCWVDEVDYLCEMKFSDTSLVLADNLDPVPMLMPIGACNSAMNFISATTEQNFISSLPRKKEEPWRSDNGQSYSDVPRDGITIFNQEQVGKFESQEIVVNALFDVLKEQR